MGVATGLAWTPTGGDILFIEASTMPGSGKLQLTGQLGDVMQESVHCAVSWIRANSGSVSVKTEQLACPTSIQHAFHCFSMPQLFLPSNPLEGLDLHVHVPSGSVPKDGPSAGVAMIAAVFSVLCNTSIPHDIAMTGEITLSGRVTAVGGAVCCLLILCV